MIQRKQTLFMLAALVLIIVCLCLPVATLVTQSMDIDSQVTNLWIRNKSGVSFTSSPLFVILLLTCPLTLCAIFKYHHRLFQARLCVANMVLIVAWYAYYAFLWFTSTAVVKPHSPPFCPSSLPFFILWHDMQSLQTKSWFGRLTEFDKQYLYSHKLRSNNTD